MEILIQTNRSAPISRRASSEAEQARSLRTASRHRNALRPLSVIAALSACCAVSLPVHAVDGCIVLLCLAAPSWSAIPQCVPPIRQLLRDLARGRAFPICGMSGPGNTATHNWASAPDHCPPQYTRVFEGELGLVYSCDYAGAVAVNVDGALWSRTWWTMAGGTVTEYTPAAKAKLGTWETRFDDDYAAWVASLPPTPLPCPSC